MLRPLTPPQHGPPTRLQFVRWVSEPGFGLMGWCWAQRSMQKRVEWTCVSLWPSQRRPGSRNAAVAYLGWRVFGCSGFFRLDPHLNPARAGYGKATGSARGKRIGAKRFLAAAGRLWGLALQPAFLSYTLTSYNIGIDRGTPWITRKAMNPTLARRTLFPIE